MQDRSTQRDVRIRSWSIVKRSYAKLPIVFVVLFPYISFGSYMENREDTDCDFFFASVQKLHRNLHVFSPNHFDYIIIDEVHHAAAKTYRKILSHFQPDFYSVLLPPPKEAIMRISLLSLTIIFHLWQISERELIESANSVPLYWKSRYNRFPAHCDEWKKL